MLLDAAMILPVDDALATQHAATTEPMAVGLHAARAGGFSDEPAVIYGCGPVGLATIGAFETGRRRARSSRPTSRSGAASWPA